MQLLQKWKQHIILKYIWRVWQVAVSGKADTLRKLILSGMGYIKYILIWYYQRIAGQNRNNGHKP